MGEIHGHSELQEVNKPEVENFRQISPDLKAKYEDSKAYIKEVFESTDTHYVPYEERLRYTPLDSERGSWEGERGESKFIPSDTTEDGCKAKQKLAEYGLDGIEYKNAEPDFSKCSEATVKIDNMTENRFDYLDDDGNYCQGNFSQADAKCAARWSTTAKDGKANWTAIDVRTWRHNNNCSWHECCDTQTMNLVPREIHGACTHSGGVAECKARNVRDNGGVFDE